MTDRNEELEQLKKEADELGVKYHHMAGPDKIRKAIDRHQAVMAEKQAKEAAEQVAQAVVQPMTPAQFQEKELERKRRESNRLIRIRVQCMNPNKKAWRGEIISVGSAKLGTYKKFVPFNEEEPYHVPKIIYEEMKARKCRLGTSTKGKNGQVKHTNRLVPEFNIEVVPPMTVAEIKELARQQAMRGGADDENMQSLR